MPPPKRLLQWITLTYVAYGAAWSRMSPPAFARTLEIHEKRWARLRRLLPGHARQDIKTGDKLLTAVIFALADEISLPRRITSAALAQLSLSA